MQSLATVLLAIALADHMPLNNNVVSAFAIIFPTRYGACTRTPGTQPFVGVMCAPAKGGKLDKNLVHQQASSA
jgi:hypothetical protein